MTAPEWLRLNWGRWGADDQRGTLNYITPEVTQAAARLVRRGVTYDLGTTVGTAAPRTPARLPTIRSTRRRGGATGRAFGDDYLTFNTHTSTHVDSLAHVWWDGQLYNGHDAEVHVTSWDGATRNGIETMGGFATRGVLLDVAGRRGVPHLPHGHRISASELEDTAQAQGVTVRSGDALLVRTGWIHVWSEDRERFLRDTPGLGEDGMLEYLHGHQVAALGADNVAVEAWDPGVVIPLHTPLIRGFGLVLLELLDLERLAADRVHEFLFVASPLRITGALGSPLNPLAVA
jgi:kynurenine formamidase